MKEASDDEFFDNPPEDSSIPGNNPLNQLEEAMREAYEKKVREYAIKYGQLEEDEIKLLFPTFKELEAFALDLRKMRKNARQGALVIEDDNESDVDKDEDRVAVADNTKLKGSDKSLADMRLHESDERRKKTQAKAGKKRDAAFQDLAPEDRPDPDEYQRMLDLIEEAGEDDDADSK